MGLTQADKRMYSEFTAEFPFCFSCGWFAGLRQHYGYFSGLDRAHIIGGPGRKHDRRAIVMLCKLCHGLNHGATVRVRDGIILPELSKANLVWLKQVYDPDHFSTFWLDEIGIGKCPEPVEPDVYFRELFAMRLFRLLTYLHLETPKEVIDRVKNSIT